MFLPQNETRNKYNNFIIRTQIYKTYPYKMPITYYKWPLTNPKDIIEKIENEKKLLRERLEKKAGYYYFPIIKRNRYNSRYNEIKTYNKDREELKKLHEISPKKNKIRNNTYESNSYNSFGIRYKDRINYVCNNYFDIKRIKYSKIIKGKLSLFAKNNKRHIIKNYKFSFNQNICSICLEKFLEKDYIIYLPCFHLYHENCIFDWLKRKKNCPICKKKIYYIFDNFE